ncbi:IclR family transcriptional regulator [Faunimonas sp. B44]|uniref:IclR family transcriptional regulator n=1 Tax=Faunimonas sp. B44 TaxID=3461493 RepID=UPI0040442101
MPKPSSAIEKAFVIIERIAAAQRPVTLAQLAQATEMPKQTVHRVLQQLEEARVIQRGIRTDSFMLGRRMTALSHASLRAATATLPIRAELETLAKAVGESANLGVLNGRAVRYLERVEYAWPLRFTINPNDELPAHTVAIGKLLLAFLRPQVRRELLRGVAFERFTDWTITDPVALEAELDRIEAAGYSTNNQEYHIGLVGVAVPVVGSDGSIVAGLAIHGVIPRTSLDALSAHLPRMKATAARIGELLEEMEPSGEVDEAAAAE